MLESDGQLHRISSTSDGGWRVTVDFPGDSVTGLFIAALSTLRDRNLKFNISEPQENK